MVGDGVDLLDRDDDPLKPLDGYVDRLGDLLPEVVEVRPGDVHNPGEPGAEPHDLRELRVVEEMLEVRRTHQAVHHLRKDRIVDRRRPLRGPDEPLEAVAGIHDIEPHRVVGLPVHIDGRLIVLLPPEVHEDERRDLKAADEHLDGCPGVSAAVPGVFLITDPVKVAPDRRDELVAEGDRLFLPVDLLFGGVEGVMRHHLKERQVAPRPADGVEIV